jgi:hypothetical protein
LEASPRPLAETGSPTLTAAEIVQIRAAAASGMPSDEVLA